MENQPQLAQPWKTVGKTTSLDLPWSLLLKLALLQSTLLFSSRPGLNASVAACFMQEWSAQRPKNMPGHLSWPNTAWKRNQFWAIRTHTEYNHIIIMNRNDIIGLAAFLVVVVVAVGYHYSQYCDDPTSESIRSKFNKCYVANSRSQNSMLALRAKLALCSSLSKKLKSLSS